MSEAKLEAYFFTTLFIGVLLVTARLFYPFLGALALALVLASLGLPLYDRINKRIKRESVAALIVVFIMTCAVLVPATLLFFLLLGEVNTVAQAASHFDLGILSGKLSFLETQAHTVFPMLSSLNIASFAQYTAQTLGSYTVTLLTNTASALFKLFVAVFALYYFLKDGRTFVKAFIDLSPLTDDEDAQIVRKLKTVSRSLIRGTLVIAVLQGVLTGLGLVIFGVPNPVLWGSVAAVGSLVPTLGTGIVMVPAVIYLVMSGHAAAAVGLAAWGILIVGFADNLIRPYLIGHAVHIHPLFVLISVLGGIAVFGVAGFLLGPLTLGLMVALAEIYKVKIKEIHSSSA